MWFERQPLRLLDMLKTPLAQSFVRLSLNLFWLPLVQKNLDRSFLMSSYNCLGLRLYQSGAKLLWWFRPFAAQ